MRDRQHRRRDPSQSWLRRTGDALLVGAVVCFVIMFVAQFWFPNRWPGIYVAVVGILGMSASGVVLRVLAARRVRRAATSARRERRDALWKAGTVLWWVGLAAFWASLLTLLSQRPAPGAAIRLRKILIYGALVLAVTGWLMRFASDRRRRRRTVPVEPGM